MKRKQKKGVDYFKYSPIYNIQYIQNYYQFGNNFHNNYNASSPPKINAPSSNPNLMMKKPPIVKKIFSLIKVVLTYVLLLIRQT